MRIFIFAVFFMFTICEVKAQNDSTKTTLTFAAIFNSNINYYGQVTTEKFPYVLANATLRFPQGFYLSAGAYRLINYGSGLSETDLGLGYDRDFGGGITAGLAYTHSFFPANSPLLQASNANNINASVTKAWDWFDSALSADYAFGKQNDFFLSLNNSKNIELGAFFNEKNSFSITPAFEITAGTTNFYETYILEKSKRNQSKGKGKSDSAPGNSNSVTVETSEILRRKFSLLAYNFKLPLAFSRANYLAEVSYQFSILGNSSEEGVKHQQSFFGISIYYQL